MTVVPPQQWRIVGDRLTDDEAIIPMTPRDLELFRKFQEGPTEEERVARIEASLRRDQERAVQRRLKFIRHVALLGMHGGIVRKMLEEHAPQEREFGGEVLQECHGCPSYQDEHPYDGISEVHHEWPCPTWQTISDATP